MHKELHQLDLQYRHACEMMKMCDDRYALLSTDPFKQDLSERPAPSEWVEETNSKSTYLRQAETILLRFAASPDTFTDAERIEATRLVDKQSKEWNLRSLVQVIKTGIVSPMFSPLKTSTGRQGFPLQLNFVRRTPIQELPVLRFGSSLPEDLFPSNMPMMPMGPAWDMEMIENASIMLNDTFGIEPHDSWTVCRIKFRNFLIGVGPRESISIQLS